MMIYVIFKRKYFKRHHYCNILNKDSEVSWREFSGDFLANFFDASF